MNKLIRPAGILILIVIMMPVALWLSLPFWLPVIAGYFLPPNISISIQQRPQIIKNGFSLNDTSAWVADCRLAQLNDLQVSYLNGGFTVTGQRLEVDNYCIDQLPAAENSDSAPLSLVSIQQQLPLFNLHIAEFSLLPWPQYAGEVQIINQGNEQRLTHHSPLADIAVTLNEQRTLTFNSLRVESLDRQQLLTLTGHIEMPDTLDRLPVSGALSGNVINKTTDAHLKLDLDWLDAGGRLLIQAPKDDVILLDLPWRLNDRQLNIEQGQWSWPYEEIPVSGGINIILSDWDDDYSVAQLEGRVNILTSGHGGRANLVVSFGPDRIAINENNFHFQMTGKAGLENIAVYIGIPAIVTGNITDPTIRITSGALVRATGNLSPDITLQEARFPLAGISLTQQGINGRLQAIVNATHRQWGVFKLHLDGRAEQFLPDSGLWRWKFWGNGDLPALKAKWDVGGSGFWQDSSLNIEAMSTGFNELVYGQTKVWSPRLSLTEPLIWQREQQQFTTNLQLQADRVTFSDKSYLPKATLELALNGETPNNFVWRGQLQASPIGPIRLNGRWDGERLRGEAWWPKQSLKVFQTLLAPDSGINIRDGSLYAQAGFSASEQQGLEAGGHIVVNDGSLWLKEGEMAGLDFIASYRLKDHIWHLGTKGPISLNIAHLNNLFDMRNISAKLQGNYPYNDRNPLRLSDVSVDMLGGQIAMANLRLPQQQAAVLTINHIELSELFTVLKPKQIAMSGKVNGELPFYLDDANWLVKDGWIENDNFLTLRLDQQLVEAIIADNAVAGAAMDWLRYVEISRSRADINVSNLGILTMDVQIKGVNSAKSKEQPIILNYRQEENIFQLWRSLRFGDNLQEQVEQHLSAFTGM